MSQRVCFSSYYSKSTHSYLARTCGTSRVNFIQPMKIDIVAAQCGWRHTPNSWIEIESRRTVTTKIPVTAVTATLGTDFRCANLNFDGFIGAEPWFTTGDLVFKCVIPRKTQARINTVLVLVYKVYIKFNLRSHFRILVIFPIVDEDIRVST